MATQALACARCAAAVGLLAGCSSPFEPASDIAGSQRDALPEGVADVPRSVYRKDARPGDSRDPSLPAGASPDEYIRYALYHSPEVEAAYQRWRASAERLPQVRALPDPRLRFGFFLDEVETRTGAQQARVGVSQRFPWPGTLGGREEAAARAARAAWRRFETARLEVTERVVGALHELAYLDGAIGITRENLDLLTSFEAVVRARYRVGTGSHPELVRVQVELGQLEDRLAQLEAMRPAFVADLNAALNRPGDTDVPRLDELPGRVAALDGGELAALAREANPGLLGLDERVEEERVRAEVARKEGLPDLTVGLDYFVTDEAFDSSIGESGDDPILLSFGINVPLWREKYKAGVREALARRLAVSREREGEANRIAASIHRAWFEHTDAHRRVRLFERTLIPKAEQSLRASLAGFRAGETSFLDLLDTERTLLEFALSAERAKADRGQALARLQRLVGEPVPTEPAKQPRQPDTTGEAQP